MILGKIGAADAAQKLDITQYLRFIHLLIEAAILVLNIPGGQNHIVGYFDKLSVIATLRTGNLYILKRYHTAPSIV